MPTSDFKNPRVRDVLATTSSPRGVAGSELVPLAGILPEEAAAEMSAAIEAGCEQVDPSEW